MVSPWRTPHRRPADSERIGEAHTLELHGNVTYGKYVARLPSKRASPLAGLYLLATGETITSERLTQRDALLALAGICIASTRRLPELF